MTPIEQKRKELEIELSNEGFNRLSGVALFNLGVEMARKEFLDFLESDKIKWLIKEADLMASLASYKPIGDKIKELKQKLEDKI